MRALGVDWTGDAATNAGSTLQRAADWSANTGASHGCGGETVEGYGESFESLRGKVHWDDPWAWGWNDTASAAASVATLNPAPFLGNLTADYFTTAQQNRTNDVTAVAALRAHEEQTRNVGRSVPEHRARTGRPISRSQAPTPAAGAPLTARPPRRVHRRRCGEPRPGQRRLLPRSAPQARAERWVGPRSARTSLGELGSAGAASGDGIPGIGPGGIPVGTGGRRAARRRPSRRHDAGRWPGPVQGGPVGGAAPVGGGLGGVPRPSRAGGSLDGRAGGAIPGWRDRRAGSDPRGLRGGLEPPGGAVGGALRALRRRWRGPGIGVGGGLAGGAAGGWRDVIGRPGPSPA